MITLNSPVARAHVALLALACLLVPRHASAQWLPAEKEAVSLGVSLGGVELDGAEDSHPPGGRTSVWAVKLAVPVAQALSIEGEFAQSGVLESGGSAFFRERRRDVVGAVYARVNLWRKGIVSVSPVLGVGVVKPTRQLFGIAVDPATGEMTDRRLSDEGYPKYPHTWAWSWGSDVWIGTGRVAIVPEFRAHEHLDDPSPWLAARIVRTMYATVGLRYRF